MSGIHITPVRPRHEYTRSREPWRMEERRGVQERTVNGCRHGWRLFHYLSGGGMRACGRGIRAEEQASCRQRFLAVAAVLAVVYLVLWWV